MTLSRRDLPVIAIVGPTAVGKTDVTLGVARRLGAEVISADSMQVYRGMDIGTAKPTLQERTGVPHHLIDIVDPSDSFSVADWVGLARRLLIDIRARGRPVVVSGGTPLYFEALLGRYRLACGAEPNPAVRERLRREAAEFGPRYLRGQLEAVDPIAAARIHPSDLKRTVRALEVYLVAGKPLTMLEQEDRPGPADPRAVFFGLTRPREDLNARIEARVEGMLRAGLLDEVRRLLSAGYSLDLASMQGVGYKEMAGYLLGRTTYSEAVRLTIGNTRRLAKRQMTWFGGDSRIHWMRPGINIQVVVEDIVTSAGGKQ